MHRNNFLFTLGNEFLAIATKNYEKGAFTFFPLAQYCVVYYFCPGIFATVVGVDSLATNNWLEVTTDIQTKALFEKHKKI